MDPVVLLPEEVIVEHIFPELQLNEICTLRCVSNAWKEAANTCLSRIKKLDLTELKDILTDVGFRNIAEHLSKLREIYMDRCWTFTTKMNLLQLFKNCQFLKIFSSKRCKHVDDEVLEELAVNCPNLEIVNIGCCYQITSTGIIELFRKCKELRSFVASGNYGFTDTAINFISGNSINIEELDIGYCLYITDNGLEQLLNGKYQ